MSTTAKCSICRSRRPEGYFVAGGDPKQLVVIEGRGTSPARETGTEEDEE
jgi:hypothetical protein